MPKVAVVMGSINDLEVMEEAVSALKRFGIESECRVISAHRTPDLAHEFSKNAVKNNFEVIVAGAGKAAHLAGVLASFTTIPVIGVPVKSSTMDGLDSLLSTVQMPQGIPVATVAINGGFNAGLLAVQILAGKYPELQKKLKDYKTEMAEKIAADDLKLQGVLNGKRL